MVAGAFGGGFGEQFAEGFEPVGDAVDGMGPAQTLLHTEGESGFVLLVADGVPHFDGDGVLAGGQTLEAEVQDAGNIAFGIEGGLFGRGGFGLLVEELAGGAVDLQAVFDGDAVFRAILEADDFEAGPEVIAWAVGGWVEGFGVVFGPQEAEIADDEGGAGRDGGAVDGEGKQLFGFLFGIGVGGGDANLAGLAEGGVGDFELVAEDGFPILVFGGEFGGDGLGAGFGKRDTFVVDGLDNPVERDVFFYGEVAGELGAEEEAFAAGKIDGAADGGAVFHLREGGIDDFEFGLGVRGQGEDHTRAEEEETN